MHRTLPIETRKRFASILQTQNSGSANALSRNASNWSWTSVRRIATPRLGKVPQVEQRRWYSSGSRIASDTKLMARQIKNATRLIVMPSSRITWTFSENDPDQRGLGVDVEFKNRAARGSVCIALVLSAVVNQAGYEQFALHVAQAFIVTASGLPVIVGAEVAEIAIIYLSASRSSTSSVSCDRSCSSHTLIPK